MMNFREIRELAAPAERADQDQEEEPLLKKRQTWLILAAAGVLGLATGRKTFAAVYSTVLGRRRMPREYAGLVDFYAKKHGLRPALIQAVVTQESGWNPRAYRAEPHLKDASRGLGQILFNTARQYGFRGKAEDLFNPSINLDWTALILARLWKKYRNLNDVFAAYNAGSPRKNKSGAYINQKYVNSVNSLYRSYIA